MEKKSLIKYLSLMGLTLASSSCEKFDKGSLDESLDSSIPLKSSQTAKAGFTPIMEINFPNDIKDQIIALSMLAQDIFENPAIAQSFSQNPQGYFASKGLSDSNIDMNSGEVKAILAFGDPEIRNAIESKDLDRFVHLLESKQYISLDNNSSIKAYIESQIKANKEVLDDLPLIEKSMFWISNFNNYVFIYTHFWFIGTACSYVVCDDVIRLNNGILKTYDFNNPVLKIWGLKTASSDIPVVNELIEKNLNKIVDAIEKTNAYQQSNAKMEHEDLKNWLRKSVTQSFIDNL